MSKGRAALLLVPLLLAAAAAGYMVSLERARLPQLVSGTAIRPPRPLPAFSLTDHHGAPFSRQSLQGRPALLFFGFTHCPDVCPATLALLARLHRTGTLRDVQPVFVSVDPQRDDTAALQRYAAVFDDELIALRGEDAQLAPLLAGLTVLHDIVPLPGGGYTVDHSAALYYINARGQWSGVFTAPFDFDNLQRDLAALVASGH